METKSNWWTWDAPSGLMYMCTACGEEAPKRYAVCPCCGRKMVNGTEEKKDGKT